MQGEFKKLPRFISKFCNIWVFPFWGKLVLLGKE